MNPTKPSSYEMRRTALLEALERAERAEAAAAKLEKMLAHAEERVRHNYEVAMQRSKVIDVMRDALERIAGGMPRGLHLTEAMAMEAFAEKALARAKEAGL